MMSLAAESIMIILQKLMIIGIIFFQINELANRTIMKLLILLYISDSFKKYTHRIHKNNSLKLMSFLRMISPIKIFPSIRVHLSDISKTFKIDIVRNQIIEQSLNDSDIFLLLSN